MTITVRKAEKADAKEIGEIENECFSHPWSQKDILESMENFTVFFVSEFGDDNKICGYCGMQLSSGGFVTNVAVKKACRRNGVAGKLLEALIDFSIAEKLEFITLEVRESNTAAIKLYKKYGFKPVGKRPSFYCDPREDALLMTINF